MNSFDSQSLFLEAIREYKGVRVPFVHVAKTFLKIYKYYEDHSNKVEPLMELLEKLEANGEIVLPSKKSKHLWDNVSYPPAPKWVKAKIHTPKSQYVSNVAWLPQFSHMVSSLRPSQLAVLEKINAYLIDNQGQLTPVPFRERALKMLGDEKALEAAARTGGLFNGLIPLEELFAFEAFEPMPYQLPKSNIRGRPIIVLENHHSFASFVIANEKQNAFSAVCFSSGNTLASREKSLESICEQVKSDQLLYLGDIDPPGFSFPVQVNISRIARKASPLKPAIKFYRWLARFGQCIPTDKEHAKTLPANVHTWLENDITIIEKATELAASSMRIPQESLGLQELRCMDLIEMAS